MTEQKLSFKTIIISIAIAIVSGSAAPWWVSSLKESLLQMNEWLPSEKYQEVFHMKLREKYYPQEVRGALKDRREVYQATWAPLPSFPFCFHSRHGLSRAEFDNINRTLWTSGYTQRVEQVFTDSWGKERFQATWTKNGGDC